jgi:hypothetical protein
MGTFRHRVGEVHRKASSTLKCQGCLPQFSDDYPRVTQRSNAASHYGPQVTSGRRVGKPIDSSVARTSHPSDRTPRACADRQSTVHDSFGRLLRTPRA